MLLTFVAVPLVVLAIYAGMTKIGDPDNQANECGYSQATLDQLHSTAGYGRLQTMGVDTARNGLLTGSEIAASVLGTLKLTGTLTTDQRTFYISDPRSGLNVTLNNWTVNDIVTPDAADLIREEVDHVLATRSSGEVLIECRPR